MDSEGEDFNLSGPLHLTAVDWQDINHRRAIAACLVQGIYVVERDRQLQREDSQALAPPWWESFHFKLIRHLIDDSDFAIFGGIYEYKPPSPSRDTIKSIDHAPHYVIAFRGTLTKPSTISRDFELDLHIIRNGLHRTSRFEIGMQAVRSMAASVGEKNIWLTGHSLGAAMALLVGKHMARAGMHVESFLFNPPFLSPPIERIKDTRIKNGIRIAGSVITAGLAFAVKAKQSDQQQSRSVSEDSFEALASWVPYIYVNPGDHLCSEFIGYFEHRNRMEEIGIGSIEKLASQHSLGGLLMSAMGREGVIATEEPLHVVPSAKLTQNLAMESLEFKEAHGLHQWWRDDQRLETKVYLYK